MCTVTYLPKKDGCIITSNRDEINSRDKALIPKAYAHNGHELIFPKDPVAGGTWICAGKSALVCLFNGAFKRHRHNPPYRHSRGLVPLAVFEYKSVEDFLNSYEFDGIEPFSLVIYKTDQLTEIKWDGTKAHHIIHDPSKPYIWASATLYDEPVREERREWFEQWLRNTSQLNQNSITKFHSTNNEDSINGLLIDRPNGLTTVSITSFDWKKTESSFHVYYHDRLSNVQTEETIRLK